MASSSEKFALHEKRVPPLWDLAKKELAAAHCPWRLRLIKAYPWIRVRHTVAGEIVADFKVEGLRWYDPDDIRMARDLCLKAQKDCQWPIKEKEPELEGMTWQALAARTIRHLQDHFIKAGSRKHYIADMKYRIATFDGSVSEQRLKEFVTECTLPDRRHEYQKRCLTLHHINKAIAEIDLDPVIKELRKIYSDKMTGAKAKLAQVGKDKVRVIPSDNQLQEWLDSIDTEFEGIRFYQLTFAYLATYGLRPHELWHIAGINSEGWLTIPGGPQPDDAGHCWRTKSKASHDCPPVPAHWVERYGLRQNLDTYLQVLRNRWRIKWAPIIRENAQGLMEDTGFTVPENNHQLGRYVGRLLTPRPAIPCGRQPTELPPTVQPLIAPLASGKGVDRLLPYDLRHSYAIRCAVHPETIGWPMSAHAEWMGHGEALHKDTYLKWIDRARKDAGISAQMALLAPKGADQAPDLAQENQELQAKIAKLQRQVAALAGLE
ncbi:MAG: hypothetical protein ACO3ST_02535 [Burkholderiaceae bacterium]